MKFSVRAVCAAVVLLVGAGCGYHVSGKGETLPKTLRTIAVPPFTNLSVRYRLTDSLPEAISRELITRTRYRVIPDASQADAYLSGTVLNVFNYPIITDPTLGRATALQIIVRLSVTLTERATGKVLWTKNWESHSQYEISEDPNKYFDESGTALDRLARDVARDIVTSILENF